MNTGENCSVHIEGKLCVAEFFNAVVLSSKILVDDACCVVGGIEDGGDLDDIGSSKRGKVFF